MKTKNVSEQIKDKIERSNKFKKKLDKITNGQIILFVKHCKVNLVRTINDEMFEDMRN